VTLHYKTPEERAAHVGRSRFPRGRGTPLGVMGPALFSAKVSLRSPREGLGPNSQIVISNHRPLPNKP
jgi:hypothetical protein